MPLLFLIIQFTHGFNLVTVNLLGLTRFRVFIRHQTGIVIHLRFAVRNDGAAIGGFTA